MTSRIKAMITEEVCRRKGRHRRSSSYPTRMPTDEAPLVHRVDNPELDPYAETAVISNDSLDQQDNDLHSLVSSLLDPLLPTICGESGKTGETCPLCASMHTKNYLRQSELGEQLVKDHTVLQDELVYAIEPSKVASIQESRLFFDALDLLNIRKELFLKVLQDPNSSLAHHLHHNQRATASRLGLLTKSVSFPAPISSGNRAPLSNNHKPHVCIQDTNGSGVTSSEAVQGKFMVEASTSADSPEPKELRKPHVNKLIMKRFKNLRAKITLAIKESRKERQRIVMDGVLDKIPYGYPKTVTEEGVMQNDYVAQNWCKYIPGDGSKNDQFFSGNSGRQGVMRRTASFSEPLSRYNRLLELCSRAEVNNHKADESNQKTGTGSPISMARILSLPDMRSYSFSHVERLTATNSSDMALRPDPRAISSAEISSLVNKKIAAFENKVPIVPSLGNDSAQAINGIPEPSNESVVLEKRRSIDDQDISIELLSDIADDPIMEVDATVPEDSELARDGEPHAEDLIPQEEEFSLLNLQNELRMDISSSRETDTPQRQTYINDPLCIQVDMKNRADFNYVRDVLELSGLIGTEFLGKWYSEDQPVDPKFFDEVEGCVLAQPGCSGNEEGGSCNHLLLFDLINEVLLEIYGKTFSYWPKLLTSCSQIHPMPVGYHVLEDVWSTINWYLRRRPEIDPSLDDAVNHDLSKNDGWMNIQFEAECVGIELEDLIFDDLLEELVFLIFEFL
ncbi:OLC1v1034839C3 [Oldenlandia corymbosa var. corymbosa]|nr:OLC1v1034839C3 [Oldenlandia corymbosa var. corymbosa]